MSTLEFALILFALAVAAVALVIGARIVQLWRRYRRIDHGLRVKPLAHAFSEEMIEGYPEPAQRYLRHAIAPGTPLARSVTLRMTGKMKPNPKAKYAEMSARERLTPFKGFVWRARMRMGRMPIIVWDHYLGLKGAVLITLAGVIPIEYAAGPDVSRSARHRLAAESIWVPSALLPYVHSAAVDESSSAEIAQVTWEAVDKDRVKVTLPVDGEDIALWLELDEAGRLLELRMQRYGNAGGEPWGTLPYGFVVEAERTFGGYTIPSVLSGGWSYGSEDYDPDSASRFVVVDARYE